MSLYDFQLYPQNQGKELNLVNLACGLALEARIVIQ